MQNKTLPIQNRERSEENCETSGEVPIVPVVVEPVRVPVPPAVIVPIEVEHVTVAVRVHESAQCAFHSTTPRVLKSKSQG